MIAPDAVTRAWATLRIWGAGLDPDSVTSRLRITPSNSYKAGDHHGKHDRLIWKEGHWDFTSEGAVESTDLGLHIEWLLDRIEPVRKQLEEITEQPGVKADIFCFWETERVNSGFDLAPSLMGRIASLRLILLTWTSISLSNRCIQIVRVGGLRKASTRFQPPCTLRPKNSLRIGIISYPEYFLESYPRCWHLPALVSASSSPSQPSLPPSFSPRLRPPSHTPKPPSPTSSQSRASSSSTRASP